ncbi:MAG: hypothetical protein LBP59_06335 [Planctomycetaceae bacterium]|jgi:hypothetical protein|nr:hypothetical protein [Planctomycetaceae bacterium]
MSSDNKFQESNNPAADNIPRPINIPLISFLLRIFGSLTFGIIMMVLLVILLAWGTLIESAYGRRVATFAIYNSNWFAGMLAIFGLNIFCSILNRLLLFRFNLPFLISHCGILLILLGAAFTWLFGEEAQITIPEGVASEYAVKTDSQQFTIENIALNSTAAGDSKLSVTIPFEPGPFNWNEYKKDNQVDHEVQSYRDTLWLALQFARRNTGKLSLPDNLNGVNIEVLDFYAGSSLRRVLPMKLNLLWRKIRREVSDLGEVTEFARNWESVELSIPEPNEYIPMEVRGQHVEMSGGERIGFYVTTNMTELDAFKNGKPNKNTDFGKWGQLVFYFNGKNHYVNVDKLLQETDGGKSFHVPSTDFTITDVRFIARGLILRFAVVMPSGERRVLLLDADNPEVNIHAPAFGLFASYFVDPKLLAKHLAEYVAEGTIKQLAQPRIEFLQAPDKQLYYRFWDGGNISETGAVPDPSQMNPPGSKPVFTIGKGTDHEVEIRLEWFEPHDLPGWRIVPQHVGRSNNATKRVLLRVTVDGFSDTFWLRSIAPTLGPAQPERDQIRYVCGKGRTISIVWNYATIDLGFGIFLKKFVKRTEPGTRMASYYSSLVDFVNIKKKNGKSQSITQSTDEFNVISENVTISMNQPAVFNGNGRRYRIYQSEFSGPFHPGDFRFHDFYDGNIFAWETKPRDRLYLSTLSINADPGRGLKYLGSFMLLFGIAWLFYGKKTRNSSQ